MFAAVGLFGNKNHIAIPRFQIAAKRAGHRKKHTLRAHALLLLDEPTSSLSAMLLHMLQMLMIVLSVLTIVLLSSQNRVTNDDQVAILLAIDFCCDLLFSIELLVRVVATSDKLLLLLTDPFLYADVAAVVPSVVLWRMQGPLHLRLEGGRLQPLQVVKLIRVLKMARHYEGSRVLWGALKMSFSALMVPLYFLLSMMLIFAAVLYLVEAEGPAADSYNSILNSMW